ncbi:MAG: FRG domain-containing protein [Candidatus Competibacter sp.]
MFGIKNIYDAVKWSEKLLEAWGFGNPSNRQPPIHVWYRGHSDSDKDNYKLIPNCFRDAAETSSTTTFEEGGMLIHLMRRLPSCQDRCPSTFDALSLSRHYGLPCRLLDWTENVLIALWFAVEANNRKDGKIFALNPGILNDKVEFEHFKKSREPGVFGPESFHTVVRAELAMTAYLDELFLRLPVRESALTVGFSNQFIDQLVKVVILLKEKDIKHLENTELNKFLAKTYSMPEDFLDSDTEEACAKLYDLLPVWLQTSSHSVSSPPGKAKEAKKWIFDFLYSLRMPIGVFPDRRNIRIAAQSGMFVLAGGDYLPNKLERKNTQCRNPNPIHLQEWYDKDDVLKWAIIPNGSKKDIFDELEMIGFHSANLFPDFDKQADYIKDYWKVDKWTGS